ncbi:MAG TPA: hypothetical protein VFR87_02670 [Nocardioidaceae bacterium]|nr:hypothetical protein [Nocardioidaceae bacterium]
MTDDRHTPGIELADLPLDAIDAALLREVAALYDAVDPVPADLVDRVRFSLALDEVFDEVAQLTRMPADTASVRTELADAVRTHTLSFAAERLTAMVTVSRAGVGRVRVDGWVTPPGERRVSIRMQGAAVEVLADETGRFVVDSLREGFVQLVFHPLEGEDASGVVTPLFKLSAD